jgi:hypothetical protein
MLCFAKGLALQSPEETKVIKWVSPVRHGTVFHPCLGLYNTTRREHVTTDGDCMGMIDIPILKSRDEEELGRLTQGCKRGPSTGSSRSLLVCLGAALVDGAGLGDTWEVNRGGGGHPEGGMSLGGAGKLGCCWKAGGTGPIEDGLVT